MSSLNRRRGYVPGVHWICADELILTRQQYARFLIPTLASNPLFRGVSARLGVRKNERHAVSSAEVEQVFFNAPLLIVKRCVKRWPRLLKPSPWNGWRFRGTLTRNNVHARFTPEELSLPLCPESPGGGDHRAGAARDAAAYRGTRPPRGRSSCSSAGGQGASVG